MLQREEEEDWEARRALACYPEPFQNGSVARVAEAGLSGSRVWRVRGTDEACALRRWNAAMTEVRLASIHRILERCLERDVRFVPRPYQTGRGDTYVRIDEAWWELGRWMPGEADRTGQPSPARLANAAIALARWHASIFPADFSSTEEGAFGDPATWSAYRAGTRARSPGLIARLAEWHRRKDSLERPPAMENDPWDLESRTRLAVRRAEPWMVELAAVLDIPIPLRVCIGDPHREHVLFVGEEVTGVVDFEAVCLDTPARDLARMLGSLTPFDRQGWRIAVEAYTRVLPLAPPEWRLIDLFDRTGLVVAVLRWWNWHGSQCRSISSPTAEYRRWSELVERLEPSVTGGLAT